MTSDQIISSIKAPIDHPLFFPRVFALVAKKRQKKENELASAICEEYEELSRRLDRTQLQESCSVRNVLRTRKLAQLLINEKGDLQVDLLEKAIPILEMHLYSLGPQRQYDAKRQEHLLKVLKVLSSEKKLALYFKKFERPISNRWAEEIIRDTLQLPAGTVITDAHAKQAVLSAWLCLLRQNVGSCFATAPAEIVHGEQPEQFLQDLLDLLSTGRLKRIFGGVEYSVPLSASWGSGDFSKPIFLRISSSRGVEPEVWYSPGLIAALIAIGFIGTEETLKSKIKRLENWMIPFIQQRSHPYPYCILTAEEIIRAIVLQMLGLTEKNLMEFEARPRVPVQPQLIVQVAKDKKNSGTLGERCNRFYFLFAAAKNAFIGLADNALLKAWEFTLASFSETKFEFARWNLYASLGLKTNEPNGIGQCIHQIIQEKLDQANQKVQEVQYEYETVFTMVKTLEARMRHTSTEKELQWLRMEYQSRRNEFFFLEEQRDGLQEEARRLVDLYDLLYEQYVNLFKDYFQEVYDADLHEISTSPYDDSPAGYRLLYKHGRSNTSQWTLIKNPTDFIESLASFFTATEPQISHMLEGERIKRDFGIIVTAIINHVKTNEFLESAFHRMAAAHNAPIIKNPLEHLDKVEKKPWVYTSGGTMRTLTSCYFRIEGQPKVEEKWVESEVELLVFLADVLKHMPSKMTQPYVEGKRKSILMESPTHAFLLEPMSSSFREAWGLEEYTYTSIRDRFIRPAEMFIESMLINNDMIDALIQLLSEKIPENLEPRFKTILKQIKGPITPPFLRHAILQAVATDRGLSYGQRTVLSADDLDNFLYSTLPFFPSYQLKDRLHRILTLLPDISSEKTDEILRLFDQLPQTYGGNRYLSSQQLQNICKALLCLNGMTTTASVDYHLQIALAAQKLGYAMPAPIIFADTNWVKDEFGFLVNPGTGSLELWRVDYTGTQGFPMRSWKKWLNGSSPNQKWAVYSKPSEYGQS
jgi:hypothetical protein